MKRFKKTLACLLVLVLLVAMVPAAFADDDSLSWTIMVYICGADLESEAGFATDNIAAMLSVDLPDDVVILLETGGALEWQNEVMKPNQIGRYLIDSDDIYEVETLPNADMGDPNTLADFVAWGTELAPAEHTGLILWNHGGGSISGVCFDESTYNSISIQGLSEALDQTLTNRLDFIGFDACLMDTLETAYMVSPYAQYLYGSEEVEPGAGWDYESLLGAIAADSSIDAAELGKVQVDSYYQYNEGDEPGSSLTFAVIDLDALQNFYTAFDTTMKEIVDGGMVNEAARAAIKADNFSNSKEEGYTNMIDVADFLAGISDMAPSAADAIKALDAAVVACRNSDKHAKSGGLSMYYPLSVGGSNEISIFAAICPSNYYREFVGEIAGVAMEMQESGSGETGIFDASCPLNVSSVGLDDEGSLIVDFNDMDSYAYGSCSIFMENVLDDGSVDYIYLGEDDDVINDYDNLMVTDNFDGSWVSLDGNLIPIELIDSYNDISEYSCSVLLNGEETFLHIAYDFDAQEFIVLGTWAGINQETGIPSRDTTPLKDGDVLEFLYYYFNSNDEEGYYYSEPVTVNGDLNLSYDLLPTGDYYYAINLYDIYGNVWTTDFVVFGVEDDGSVYFYTD